MKELENLNKEEKIKYLQNQIEMEKGILAHQKELSRETDKKIGELKQLLYIESFEGEVCEHNYYGVRAGKCEYGTVYHGKIHCNNPNCKA